MLEDKLREVWKYPACVDTQVAVELSKMRLDSESVAGCANYDYRTYKRLNKRPSNYTRKCCRTAKLVRAHMIEALSSPIPYIREWGRLVAKEGNGRVDGACCS